MSRKFAKVREDDMIKLFVSIPFRRSLSEDAAFTKNTGYESAFRVARDFYIGRCHVSEILRGRAEDLDVEGRTYEGEFADFDFSTQAISSNRCHRFLDLHFHPGVTKWPVPSYADLLGSQASVDGWEPHWQVDVRPVVVVAHVLENDDIVTLLYQKKYGGYIGQMQRLEELESDLYKAAISEPSRAVDYLEASGIFSADILTLKKKYSYRPPKEDNPKLTRYVHTPKRKRATLSNLHQDMYTEF